MEKYGHFDFSVGLRFRRFSLARFWGWCLRHFGIIDTIHCLMLEIVVESGVIRAVKWVRSYAVQCNVSEYAQKPAKW